MDNKTTTSNNNSGGDGKKDEGAFRKASNQFSVKSNQIFTNIKASIRNDKNEKNDKVTVVVDCEHKPANNSDDNNTNNNQSNDDGNVNTSPVNKPKTIVDGVGKGIVSFGTSIIHGAKGIVEKPIQGAKQGGVGGFAKGVVKGIGGAVLLPVVGVVEFVSFTVQGIVNTPLTIIDAMKSAPKDEVQSVTAIEKPIYFGIGLEESITRANESKVYHLIPLCIEFLSKHTKMEGIMRISGSQTSVQKLQVAFDRGEIKDLTLLESFNTATHISLRVHEVAGVFKSYFRFQPESIIPEKTIKELKSLQSNSVDTLEKVVAMKSIVNAIPDPNYTVLYQCLEFIQLIVADSKENLMNASNISIIFGPSWLRPDDLTNMQEVANCNTIVYHLITFFNQIFTKKPNKSIFNNSK